MMDNETFWNQVEKHFSLENILEEDIINKKDILNTNNTKFILNK